MKGSHHLPTANLYFSLSAKINGEVPQGTNKLNSLYSTTNQQLFEKQLSNQSSYCGNHVL